MPYIKDSTDRKVNYLQRGTLTRIELGSDVRISAATQSNGIPDPLNNINCKYRQNVMISQQIHIVKTAESETVSKKYHLQFLSLFRRFVDSFK